MKPVVEPSPAQPPAVISELSSSRDRSKRKESYWSNARLRLSVRTGQEEKSVIVPRPVAVVGSDPRCDIVLAGSRIPPRCFCVIAVNGVLLGSVLVDGSHSSIARFRRLTLQRSLRLGCYQLKIALLPEADGQEPLLDHSDETASEDGQETVSTLQWKTGCVRHQFDLPRGVPILVGRRAPCHLQIDDAMMSSVHCLLLSLGKNLWLVDLCSRNGMSIRHRRVAADAISRGRSFRIGKTRVRWLPGRTDPSALQVTAEAKDRRWRELREEVAQCRAELEVFEAEVLRLRAVRDQCLEAKQQWIQQQEELARQQEDWQTRQQQEAGQLSQRAEELHAEQASLARVQQEWYEQHSRVVEQWESSTRAQIAELEAHQQALQQREDAWAAERDSELQRLQLQSEQLQSDRAEVLAQREELERCAQRIQQDAQKRSETQKRLQVELAEAKSQLAKMQQERERWLVQRIRTQRALKAREEAANVGEDQLAQIAERLRVWETQLRRQQQELLDQRRRDLSLSAPETAPETVSDDLTTVEFWSTAGAADSTASAEGCLSLSDFDDVLDEVLQTTEPADPKAATQRLMPE